MKNYSVLLGLLISFLVSFSNAQQMNALHTMKFTCSDGQNPEDMRTGYLMRLNSQGVGHMMFADGSDDGYYGCSAELEIKLGETLPTMSEHMTCIDGPFTGSFSMNMPEMKKVSEVTHSMNPLKKEYLYMASKEDSEGFCQDQLILRISAD